MTEFFDRISEITRYHVLSQFLKVKGPYSIMKDYEDNSYIFKRKKYQNIYIKKINDTQIK